jgi:hypothetical protein
MLFRSTLHTHWDEHFEYEDGKYSEADSYALQSQACGVRLDSFTP